MATQSVDSDGRATKRLRLSMADGMSFSSPQLTIIVGDENMNKVKTFYASSDLLAQHSDFFAAALRNGWKEKEENLIRLPECHPEIFEIFLKFIHSGKIYSSKDDDVYKNADENMCDREWSRLTTCSAQGEKLMSSAFRDAIADTVIQKMVEEKQYPTGLYRGVHEATLAPNALSRLIVDIAVWKWDEKTLQDQGKDSAKWGNFWRDFALRLFTLNPEERKGPAPFEKADCTYHEHVKEGKPCYKTLFKYD